MLLCFVIFNGHFASAQEKADTFVPSALIGKPEVGQREWVWGMMTGMKKEYKIYKNLRGTVLIQYNIFNPKYKSPYANRLNSRIGFEQIDADPALRIGGLRIL